MRQATASWVSRNGGTPLYSTSGVTSVVPIGVSGTRKPPATAKVASAIPTINMRTQQQQNTILELAANPALLTALPIHKPYKHLAASLVIFLLYGSALVLTAVALPLPKYSGDDVDWFISIGWAMFAVGLLLLFCTSVMLLIRKHPYYEMFLLSYFTSLILFLSASVLHTSRLDTSVDTLFTNPDGHSDVLSAQLSWLGNILFYIYLLIVVRGAAQVTLKMPPAEELEKYTLLLSIRDGVLKRQQLLDEVTYLDREVHLKSHSLASSGAADPPPPGTSTWQRDAARRQQPQHQSIDFSNDASFTQADQSMQVMRPTPQTTPAGGPSNPTYNRLTASSQFALDRRSLTPTNGLQSSSFAVQSPGSAFATGLIQPAARRTRNESEGNITAGGLININRTPSPHTPHPFQPTPTAITDMSATFTPVAHAQSPHSPPATGVTDRDASVVLSPFVPIAHSHDHSTHSPVVFAPAPPHTHAHPQPAIVAPIPVPPLESPNNRASVLRDMEDEE